MTTTIYLDESGYTGEDLLKEDQPVFSICTHSISEDACAALKNRHFPDLKASELKHGRLAGRAKQANMLISALEDLATNYHDQIIITATDKRYAMCCKIIDLVIETSMHKAGFDLYKNGGNIAMANAMYACMDVDQPYHDRVLRLFYKWLRERSVARRHELIWFLKRPHPIDPIDHFRQTMYGALCHLDVNEVFEALPLGALDLSLSSALVLVSLWRKKLGDDPIELVHDQSTNMAKQKRLWDVLTSPIAPAATVGYDQRTATFPLRVTGTKFTDGKTSAALQIADIIAGAIAALKGSEITNTQSEYISKLRQLFSKLDFNGHLQFPTLDIAPEALGTTGSGGEDSLAYMAKLVAAAESA